MKRYIYTLLFAASFTLVGCESSEEVDNSGNTKPEPEVIDFTKLSHFASDAYPEKDEWKIKDEEATTADFEALRAALAAAAAEGRSIEITLSKMLEVPASAFVGGDLSALTSLECSEATTIGANAVKGAANLNVLELPMAATIEDGAFNDCTSLSAVTLYAVKSVDGFEGCTSLARFVAPKAESIEERAFAGDVMLTSISLANAETIATEAFANCTYLAEIELPAATSFGNKAFAACSNIETFTIAENGRLEKFGDESGDMFDGVHELLAVALTTGSDNEDMLNADSGSLDATSIGGAVYGPFKSINSVTPTVSNVTLADLSAETYPLDATIWNITDAEASSDDFNGLCDAIEEASVDDDKLITLRFPNLKALPEYALECYKDYDVRDFSALNRVELEVATSIGSSSFKHCEGLISVDMPKVQVVGSSAFAQCYYLESVTTAEVTTIGSYAFFECITLKSVSFPKATAIGDAILNNCRAMVTASFPLVTKAAYKMFSACISLTSVDLPLLNFVDVLAFDSCYSLQSISFPEVTEVAQTGFTNCSSLASVELPKVTILRNMAFQFCSSLPEISLPAVTTLEGATFRGCTSLTKITLPEVTVMGDSNPAAIAYGDFEDCSSLVEAELPKLVDVGTNSFRGCKLLESLSFPKGVRYGNGLVAVCPNLTYFNLSEECEIEYFGNANGDIFEKGADLGNVTLRVGYINRDMVNKGTKLFNAPTDTSMPLTYGPFKKIELANEIVGEYSLLENYSQTDFPEGSEWVIDDVEAEYDDFVGLREALLSLDPAQNHIKLKFTNLTTIPAETFKDLTAIASVELPVVNTIGNSAFEGLCYMSNISAPMAETIGDSAFEGCSMMMTLALPSAMIVGDDAFSGCSSLYSVDLSKVEYIGSGAFEGVGSTMMASITIAKESMLKGFGGSSADLFTADNVSRIAITIGSYNSALYDVDSKIFDASSIGGASYGPFASITEVAQVVDFTELRHFSKSSIPTATEWVINDEEATYQQFAGLREALNVISSKIVNDYQSGTITIKFPNLKSLPDNALFESGVSTKALVEIELGAATTVGANALRECSKLATVTMPSVESLGFFAMKDCSKLYTVSIPKLKTIADGAFSNCGAIMDIVFPYVTSVGNRAFENMTFIMKFQIGSYEKITRFGDEGGYVFGDTPSLTWTQVTLGEINEELLNREDRMIDATSIGGDVYGPFSSVNTFMAE